MWCLGSSSCVTDEDSCKMSLRLKDILTPHMKATVCSMCVSMLFSRSVMMHLTFLNVDSISKDEQIKLVINQANIAHVGIIVMESTTLQLV